MPTIEQIAKESGVSPATVSRVLRNAHNVSPATRNLVLQTAAQLGRSLPSELQGKCVLAIGSTNVPQFFAALDDAAQLHHTTLLWKYANSDNYMADDLFSMEEYDGIILIDGVMDPQALQLLRKQIPVVQCRTYSGLNTDIAVLVDDFQMGFDLAEHMIQRGCQSIMYINVPSYFASRPFARDRLRGMMAACCEAGTQFARICNSNRLHEYPDLIRQAVADGADGIILGMVPQEVYQVFQELRDHIPQDLALAAFDDSEVCEVLGITALQQPIDAIASTAMHLLHHLMEHQPEFSTPLYVRTKHELIIRSSTAVK